MKRRERKKKGNVILFPDLEKRLLIMGVESLQEKNYHQAIQFLEEAKELDSENEEVYIGLVLSYYETGNYQEAKLLAKKMLAEGIGDYFQTADLYMMILIQLHEYEELISYIEVLVEENEISSEKQVHLLNMLQFYKRQMEDQQDQHEDGSNDENEISLQSLFEEEDIYKQMLLLSELSTRNIRVYITEIKAYLISEQGNPFLKTMLLNILHDQQFDQEIEIEKFGERLSVNPMKLHSIQDQPQLLAIIEELKKHFENDDPVLYENTKKLVERQLFILYPFEINPPNSFLWAMAYYVTASEYLGKEFSLEEFCELNDIQEDSMENALMEIQKIEKISYPIF